MKFTHIKAEYIPQKPGMQGIWEKIEQAGRCCYQTECNIKYDDNGNSLTAENFASKLIKVYKHRSVTEHATIYLTLTTDNFTNDSIKKRVMDFLNDLEAMKFSKVIKKEFLNETIYYITTNYRVIVERGFEDLMKFMTKPTIHEKRETAHVFTNRGVSAEMNRHRVNSPSERSTRYVDSKDGLSISLPTNINEKELNRILQLHDQGITDTGLLKTYLHCILNDDKTLTDTELWLAANLMDQYIYNRLRERGWQKQYARNILPLDIETELVVTAFESDWKRFFDQRLFGKTGKPHPDMQATAQAIYDILPK